jgi:hypothetical protein
MNNIAITPHIAMYALQIQNIKRDTVKKLNLNDLNTEKEELKREGVEDNTTNIENLQEPSEKED